MVNYSLDHLTQPDDQKVGGPIQDDEALLLFAMIRVMRLKRILEIGGLGGYSARNFLEAINGDGAVYSVDINIVPKLARNHVVICRNVMEIEKTDFDGAPLDLVFFDCHAYEAQMVAYQRLTEFGLITDKTVLALHDTNLFPAPFVTPSYRVDGGWRVIQCEAVMVNDFKAMGYDIFCLHTDMSAHSDALPYRWGLTLASRFKRLPV